ncbi:uncharacterized protein [Dysidea avara]|uniref:uncharacterized protein n=1 Tax=Dysidea avara TaxID=196820 RepID=UPI00333025F7
MSTARRLIRTLSTTSDALRVVSREVQQALSAGKPVVALESTVVTHGMPHPSNLQMATELEDIIRSNGAVPATIGIIDGCVHVGLDKESIQRLADPSVKSYKVSRRDLSYVLSQGQCGGTTVSATMLCAHQVGIPVFVTGGIGGVHREGENTLDISADLSELGRTPVAVVCAGVKSILDIGRTLEVLETNGVTVATLGGSDQFPAFFTANSGHKSPYHLTSVQQCAALIDANITADIGSGMVIAVPIPKQASLLGEGIERAIMVAIEEARAKNISGRDITPYVLQRVNELTKGKSLEANIVLIKNNADVGSQIAVSLSELRNGRKKRTTSKGHSFCDGSKKQDKSRPVVVGASIIDFVAKILRKDILTEGTNPGQIRTIFGGVARNIAECLARLKVDPFFISAVGQDMFALKLRESFRQLDMATDGLIELPDAATATYCAVLDHLGEMYCGIGDMDILNRIEPDNISQFTQHMKEAPIVCMDGNLRVDSIKFICELCKDYNVPVWFEPTCVEKILRPLEAGVLDYITYMSPNLAELRSIYHAITGSNVKATSTTDAVLDEKLDECMKYCPVLLDNVPTVFVSLGKHGVMVGQREHSTLTFKHYPAGPDHLLPVKVTSASGAGDSFVGAVMAGIVQGHSIDQSVRAGLKASYLSLLSKDTISHDVCPEQFTVDITSQWIKTEPTVF